MTDALEALVARGKQAYSAQQYGPAAELFSEAAEGYRKAGDELNAAEMCNNLSVALLQAGEAQAAYQAAAGTEQAFASAGDMEKEAMAWGNQAAALEALGRFEQAAQAYERSAGSFAEAGDQEMRSLVLGSAARLKLRRGQLVDAAVAMIGAVEAAPRPTLLQRILKFLLRLTR